MSFDEEERLTAEKRGNGRKYKVSYNKINCIMPSWCYFCWRHLFGDCQK